MSDRFSEAAFRDWLVGRKSLSIKGSGDVVSRLKRCIKIEPLDGYNDQRDYFDAILQNPKLESVPESSRKGMSRASLLYFEFVRNESK